jgi:hypothetical protein
MAFRSAGGVPGSTTLRQLKTPLATAASRSGFA